MNLGALRQRKIVQWGIAYLAGAWVALQVIAYLYDTFAWPTAVRQALASPRGSRRSIWIRGLSPCWGGSVSNPSQHRGRG